jgi:hypothetical protein
MSKLKTGSVDRRPKEVEIDGATFYVRPLSSEMYTSFTLYIGEYTQAMLSPRDKINFIETHLTDWKNVIIDIGGKEETAEFSIKLAKELLLDPDADELITFLYSESLDMRNKMDKAKREDAEKAKK